MLQRSKPVAAATLFAGFLCLSGPLLALNPNKDLTQYTRTAWTQAQGLPQDSIRAIAQTTDGYLWLGTDEGLARFDGYEFVTFSKDSGALPSNFITSLTVGPSGDLWIGTFDGLARYSGGRFTDLASQPGMPRGTVNSLIEDQNGTIWFVSGDSLYTYKNGKFTAFPKPSVAPVEAVRVVYEDQHGAIWVGGAGGLIKRHGETFSTVLNARDLGGNVVVSLAETKGGLWVGSIRGLILIRPDGSTKKFTTEDGLSNNFVRALYADRAGNLWVGTYGGLNRIEGEEMVTAKDKSREHVWVGSLLEDREGNLWVGTGSALIRLRDDRFSVYDSAEGLPADEPTAVQQDQNGDVWVGYHASGLVVFHGDQRRTYTTRDGLPSNEVFSIRRGVDGELLIGTSNGVSRFKDGRFVNLSVPDPFGRKAIYDVLEDARGRIWAATPSGVYRRDAQGGGQWHSVVQGYSSTTDFVVSLALGRDGSLWAGTLNRGLWQAVDGKNPNAKPRLFTTADGLGSNKIRSLLEDDSGTLWICSFGGGLTNFRDGVFRHYAARDGLLSDNIAHIIDDQNGGLWLSTTRGISLVSAQQLADYSAGKIRTLTPQNFGTSDGLRSVQSTPTFAAGGGSERTRDGRLWFTTASGLAILDPREAVDVAPPVSAPLMHIDAIAVDGKPASLSQPAKFGPGTARIQFRYAGIYLRAPESLRYFYKLEGLDPDWVPANDRRVVDYSFLPHGHYSFMVRSSLAAPGGNDAEFPFEVLPHFFEEAWFLWLCTFSVMFGMYGLHRLRLSRMRSRYALVFEERARLAREIHDTLAQGFVGISHQLDALAIKLNGDLEVARRHLNLARKMVRHSLTEARRSVMDLRTSDLEDQDLPTALVASARSWAAGSPVEVRVETTGLKQVLPSDLEQNILRIAQEAVANSLKHAHATIIWVDLAIEQRFLRLRVKDDGLGFEPSGTLSLVGGHFGLLGIRERAERLGGKLALESQPGAGTQVEVTVPLDTRNSRNN